MHQEGAVAHIYDLDAVNVLERRNNFLVLRFARGVDGDVADQKILPDADDIDPLNIATGLADRSRHLTELARLIMDLDAQRNAVAGVGCWFVVHKDAEARTLVRE